MNNPLLFATRNPSKLAIVKAILAPMAISSLLDYPKLPNEPEHGESLEDIAINKARTTFDALELVCFAIDSSLIISGLSEEQQPHAYVRRLGENKRERSGQEMIAHYQSLLASLGKDIPGRWTTAIAFIDLAGKITASRFSEEPLFLSRPSEKLTPGEPLNSFQFNKNSRKYYSEMSLEERIQAMGARALGIKSFIDELPGLI